MRRWAAIAAMVLAVGLLVGCDRLRHEVTLTGVYDTEAPTVLTSQTDATSRICGVSSACVEALESDQAIVLKFADDDHALAELRADDVPVRGIFIIRWLIEVPDGDREFVRSLLETSGSST